MEVLAEWDVLVGRVRGRWDKAALKIQPFSQTPGRFAQGAQLLAVLGEEKRLFSVQSAKKIGSHWICEVGLNSTEEAEKWIGAELFVHPAMRPALPEGEFYLDELIGLEVVTQNGEKLGAIEEVLETPAHTIYVTPRAMIPGVPEYVVSTDWEKRVLVVRDVPGLVEEN